MVAGRRPAMIVARGGTPRSDDGGFRAERVDEARIIVPPSCSHSSLPDSGGAKIDFLLERTDGALVASEVKSGETVDNAAFSAIRALAQDWSDVFMHGIVLYTRAEQVPFGNNLMVLPVSSVWNA